MGCVPLGSTAIQPLTQLRSHTQKAPRTHGLDGAEDAGLWLISCFQLHLMLTVKCLTLLPSWLGAHQAAPGDKGKAGKLGKLGEGRALRV